jgi:hypothetical protein
MATKPKTRSPKNYETDKKATLSRSYLCLAHSTWLELDGDDLDLLKLDYLSWLRLLDEVLRIAPPYFTMGETLVELSSHIHYHQMDTELQANDIF